MVKLVYFVVLIGMLALHRNGDARVLSKAAVFIRRDVDQASENFQEIYVEQKDEYAARNRIEFSFSAGLSVGDVFTQQFAGELEFDYHISDNFALGINWLSSRFPFVSASGDTIRWGNHYKPALAQLKKDALLSPTSADLAMMGNYIGASFHFTPAYGKINILDQALSQVELLLSVGVGLSSTEFKDFSSRWIDTGSRLAGMLGVGLRVRFSPKTAIQLSLRDYVFAAQVKTLSSSGGYEEETTRIRNTLFVFLGVNCLFGGPAPVAIWSPY
jgi:outer membrane beta-barrel protein